MTSVRVFWASRIWTDRQVNQWVARADRRLIGETVLVNSGTRTSFLIDDEAPILRERDTLPPRQHAGQAAYLCLQT